MAKTITNAELDSVVSYMYVSFGYDYTMVLPYKDGVALLATLEKAETVEKMGYSNKTIKFTGKHLDVEIHTVSQREYREQKMAALLGVQDDETPNTV